MSRTVGMLCFLVCTASFAMGCKSTPKEAKLLPPAQVDSVVMSGAYEDVWQATRVGLLDGGFEIYTRDKRGLFVAYAKVRRHLFVWPNRTQLTVTLEELSGDSTRVSVETLEQGYRVTLLTYPDWRDNTKPAKKKKTGDVGVALLEAIQLVLESEGTESVS